jgi:hypothetical protein
MQSFWTDPVGDLISHTFKSRPCPDRVVATAHNAKAFDLNCAESTGKDEIAARRYERTEDYVP